MVQYICNLERIVFAQSREARFWTSVSLVAFRGESFCCGIHGSSFVYVGAEIVNGEAAGLPTVPTATGAGFTDVVNASLLANVKDP